MPLSCYSYPAGTPGRDAARAARRDLRRMPVTCYSYPLICFSYPDDMPPGGGNPAADHPPPPGLRRLPAGSCFRY